MEPIELWGFGYVAVILMIASPAVYVIGRQLRKFMAWTHREEGPKERKVVYIPLLMILGLIAGGFIQPYFEFDPQCYANLHEFYNCIKH